MNVWIRENRIKKKTKKNIASGRRDDEECSNNCCSVSCTFHFDSSRWKVPLLVHIIYNFSFTWYVYAVIFRETIVVVSFCSVWLYTWTIGAFIAANFTCGKFAAYSSRYLSFNNASLASTVDKIANLKLRSYME